MKKYILSIMLAAAVLLPALAMARIGVGVGTGKIEVSQVLKPGMIYQLPELTVINTGDEAAEYEITTQYHTDQPQMKPAAEWFSFEPQLFRLEAGQTKNVAMGINLPVKTFPGDYFAYIEAHPREKSSDGNTSIGVAAASKLYFTVAPANLLEGVYYRAASFMTKYSPYTWIAFFTVISLALLAAVKKFFSFKMNVSFKRK